MLRSTEIWLLGLVAAAINGGAMAITASVLVPTAVNWTHEGMHKLAEFFGAGAILGVANYLKSSPLPQQCNDCKSAAEVKKSTQS